MQGRIFLCFVAALFLNACGSAAHVTANHQDIPSSRGVARVMLPHPPRIAPDPWIPYAVEKDMGGTWCPEDPDDDSGITRYGGLHRACLGLLPQHLADVLVAIPVEHIFIPTHVRAEHAGRPQPYLAVPGRGSAPDFMTNVDILEGIWIRSFEGASPFDTVYLVIGPFDCIDDDPLVAREGEYVLETEACKAAHAERRLYKWVGGGNLRDVTREYLPWPAMTRAEKRITEPFRPNLDGSKLERVPVMRWTINLKDASPPGRADDHDYDAIPMPEWVPESRRLGDRLHLGFAVWNGKRFELRRRVSSDLWPPLYCDPLRPDGRCRVEGAVRGERRDPFVDQERTKRPNGGE